MITTAALDKTYQELGTESQDIYRTLGLLPIADIDPTMTAAVCQLSWGHADWGLQILAEEQVLEPVHNTVSYGRYQLVPTARDHARALAVQTDSEQDRQDVLRRLFKWLLAIATQARHRLTAVHVTLPHLAIGTVLASEAPFNDDAGALEWLQAVESSFLSVLSAAELAGWDDLIWQLVDAFAPLPLHRQPCEVLIAAQELGLRAARRVGNEAVIRQTLIYGGMGLSSAGRAEDAIRWYKQALISARDQEDTRAEGEALLGLGSCHHQAGHPDRAIPFLAEASSVWQQSDYPQGVALATLVIGEIVLPDNPRRALDLFAWARSELLRAGAPYDANRALALQGHARVLTGDSDAGTEDLEEALAGFTDVASSQWRARGLEFLGQALLSRGQHDTARACFTQAADLYAKVSPLDFERVRAVWSGL
ncbi:tetratricopeptide repeat protein [Streptomyces chartreusis]|uniref:Tetratricopeptide repeat protein n=1 Tax=Streptomyces chartreusis TaxID=1969 RepID=A0A7H8TK40_STRCX|nr:tetratricopeptide repeat protein [Streptomyces chartreusis]QKZ23893.1 tetratricopeptide repeat protein [Streptomyces chartreusis]